MSGETLDRERLVKRCGMFGSDHAGERANAAAAADRLVRDAGLRWPDVILPSLTGPTRHREIETVKDALIFVLDYEDVLTAWERQFCRSLCIQRRPISEKQQAILRQIVVKVRAAEAQAAAA